MEASAREENGEIVPILCKFLVGEQRGTQMQPTIYFKETQRSNIQIMLQITALNCFLFEWIEAPLISQYVFYFPMVC